MKLPETLVIFHYHLLRGGVRSAIEKSLASLSSIGWLTDKKVCVLCGRSQGVDSFLRFVEELGIQASVVVDSRLDYRNQPWTSQKSFFREVRDLGKWLLEQAEGITLFWIHNVPLGKNPLVTAAWKYAVERASEEDLPNRFLYHIHDFPECGRTQNLLRMRWCWGNGGIKDAYPARPNVGYALLNRADYLRMKRIGVPENLLCYLPNVVSGGNASRGRKVSDRRAIAGYISQYAKKYGFAFFSDRSWWLLPIRLIRRKNGLEALVLGEISQQSPQLLLTLDANSEQEKPYAEAVKALVLRLHYPMVIGFGLELVGSVFGFDELFEASEAVVTTSLMEGFGFTFLDGPIQGKPLIGRDLPSVTEDFARFGFPVANLYKELRVPLEVSQRKRMLERGTRFASRMQRMLSIPRRAVDSFCAGLEAIYAGAAVDFGYLDLVAQCRVIEGLRDRGFLDAIRNLNPSLPQRVTMEKDKLVEILNEFGPRRHASRFVAFVERLFEKPVSGDWEELSIGDLLLDEFFSPYYFKPLYGDW